MEGEGGQREEGDDSLDAGGVELGAIDGVVVQHGEM
jgi:hypothetical protein